MEHSNSTESEVSMDSVQLLASLLICYPEFSKITLDSRRKAIIMEVSVKGEPDPDTFVADKQFIIDSIKLYHDIEYSRDAEFALFYSDYSLHIYRDLATFSHNEVGLLLHLLKDRFGDNILADDNKNADEDLLATQAEMIDHRIRFLKENRINESVVAVREEGRVMVFGNDYI
ncbi:MAG: hypothetical protein K6C05_07615 [Anaerovibrio sp.]|uniref:hypothetical protein n=1 Tax=Anaerovibrio sp. TaxID=1872532 RepID=UPI0025FEA834|nr:hypothetical protein [Anaerovibrio sp.]MCR5176707.1 hypothetical protein [Anaerovibrio sp.]